MKTFFGPDKPYIQGRIGAYEQLLEAWGGVPDHLKADFGRWLLQSDEANKEQASEAGIPLDSGPGAARAAVAQLDANTLSDRGVIIAGKPGERYQDYQDVRRHRGRPGNDDHADRNNSSRACHGVPGVVRQRGDSRLQEGRNDRGGRLVWRPWQVLKMSP